MLGRHLQLRMTELKQSMDYEEFLQFTSNINIRNPFLNRLSEGNWARIDYRQLLALWGRARDAKLKLPFIELVESPFWKTFGGAGETVVFSGVDEDGHNFQPDLDLVSLLRRHFGLQTRTAHDDVAIDSVQTEMCRKNVIAIGAGKVNAVSDFCLAHFAKRLNSNIEFVWANLLNEKATAKRGNLSRDRTIRIVNGGGERNEQEREGRRLGLVAICRDPIESNSNCTSVVIAGASRQATHDMFDELEAPWLYAEYDRVAHHPGVPALLLYDSAGVSTSKWELLGQERQQRRPGRPKGSGRRRR